MIMAAIMLLEVQQRESPRANIDPRHSKLQDVEIKLVFISAMVCSL